MGLLAAVALVVVAPGPTSAEDSASHDAQVKADQRRWSDPMATPATPSHDMPMPTRAGISGATGAQRAERVSALPPPPDSLAVLTTRAVSTAGRWRRLPDLPKANAYHAVMSPGGGKVLLIAGSGNNANTFAAGTFRAYLWSVSRGTYKTIDVPTDMFCAGHTLMSDGRALAVGGTAAYVPYWKGSAAVYTFDFTADAFTRQPDMAQGRWYPTVVRDPGATETIVGGFDQDGVNTGSVERYDEALDRTSSVAGPTPDPLPLYAQLFMLGPDRMFYSGTAWATGSGHPPGFYRPSTGAFEPVAGLRGVSQRDGGASCWVGDVRRKILATMGGGWPATRTTGIVNLNFAAPAFRDGPALRSAKAYLSCVTLPTGQVLELGGGNANYKRNASREVGLLPSPASRSWLAMNPMPAGDNHRLYHSMAFLLDDGSVISMGSNALLGESSYTVWRYEPPYLTKVGVRPSITSRPLEMTYGETYRLGLSPGVTKVTLATRSSPTHMMDNNARQVTVPVVDGRITLDFDNVVMPQGYVTLWAVGANGKVSAARWTRLVPPA